jgi:hypothetical protein
MRSKKHFRKNNKTLKNKINKYIFKNDICCEDDVDRKIIIQDIFTLYSEIASFMYEKDEYLSYIGNDLLKLIGYKIDLETKNDNEGVRLWNKIKSKITLNKTSNKEKMIEVLNEVPLYYLLSFLGYAYYKYKINKDIFDNIEDK